jgi:hypothetical protein
MDMSIILFPELLRQKLGEDGAKELVELINASVTNVAQALRTNVNETVTERLEARIAETKAELKADIASTKAELIKWMFAFWAGQMAVIVALFTLFK